MNFLVIATTFCILGQQFSFLSAQGLQALQTSQIITVCENYPLVIQCPKFHRIMIISGFYGRQDKTTCMTQYPGCRNCDASCSRDITAQLINSFNNKNSFSIYITNWYAGADPCFLTYKYSTIRYTCISNKQPFDPRIGLEEQ